MGDNWWDFDGVDWQETQLVETPIDTAGSLAGPTGVDTSAILTNVWGVSDSSAGSGSASTNSWLSSLLNTAAQVLAGKKQVSYSQSKGLQVSPTASAQASSNTMLIVGGAILVAFVLLMKS